jgi:hypothetical protein
LDIGALCFVAFFAGSILFLIGALFAALRIFGL